MAEEKIRERRERRDVPPFLSLEGAVEIAKQIHSRAGGSVNSDGLVEILGSPASSSVYLRKVAALRAWGIVVKEDELFKLSSEAEAIVQPRNESEKRKALLNCFLGVDKLRRIAQLYAGKILPEDSFLLNTLTRDLQFDRTTVTEWAKTFREAGTTVGIFIDLNGRKQVRQNFDQAVIEQTSEEDKNLSDSVVPPLQQEPKPPLVQSLIREPANLDYYDLRMGHFQFRGPRTPEEKDISDIRAFLAWFEAVYGKNIEE